MRKWQEALTYKMQNVSGLLFLNLVELWEKFWRFDSLF